jgi:hypothetical protein
MTARTNDGENQAMASAGEDNFYTPTHRMRQERDEWGTPRVLFGWFEENRQQQRQKQILRFAQG